VTACAEAEARKDKEGEGRDDSQAEVMPGRNQPEKQELQQKQGDESAVALNIPSA